MTLSAHSCLTGVASREPRGSVLLSEQRQADSLDVSCGIDVPVVDGATFRAGPASDGQRQGRQGMAAVRAALAARLKARDRQQIPFLPLGLVGQHPAKLGPGRIADASGEASVLHHAAHVQVFHEDRLVFANNAGGYLVQIVTPRIGDAGMTPGGFRPVFLHVVRGRQPHSLGNGLAGVAHGDFDRLRLAGVAPLVTGQSPLLRGKQARVGDFLPGGKGRQVMQADVDTDGRVRRWRGERFFLEQQGDEVASRRIAAHRDAGGFTLRQRPAPADVQRRVLLGQRQARRAVLGAPEHEAVRHVGRGLGAVLALVGGIPAALLEESGEAQLKMAQRLLQGDAGDLLEPGEIRVFLQQGQGGGDLVVAQGEMLVEPCVALEPQTPIVDVARATEGLGKLGRLLSQRIEAEAVGAFNQRHEYTLHYYYDIVKRITRPCLISPP